MWSKLKGLAWFRLGASIALAVALALLATLVLHALSGKPRTLTSIEARSEYVSFSVINPELAILYAQGLRIVSWPDGQLDNQCAQGAFLPDVGSRVSYQRIGDQALSISVDGKGKLRKSSNEVLPFDGELILMVDCLCADALIANRLPVWGPGQIGSAFSMRSDGPSPTLLNGTLDVFGRTMDMPLWGGAGAIYAAIDDMAIPPGSVIQTDAAATYREGADTPDPEAAMFGFVELSDASGLAVSISTESPQLSITPPGARADSSRVDLSLFVQVLNDPVFLKIQLFFVLAFVLWPALMDAINLAHSRAGETNNLDRAGSKTSGVNNVIPDHQATGP